MRLRRRWRRRRPSRRGRRPPRRWHWRSRSPPPWRPSPSRPSIPGPARTPPPAQRPPGSAQGGNQAGYDRILIVARPQAQGAVGTYSSRKPPRHRNNSTKPPTEHSCPAGRHIDSTCANTPTTRASSKPVENPEQHPTDRATTSTRRLGYWRVLCLRDGRARAGPLTLTTCSQPRHQAWWARRLHEARSHPAT